MSSYGPPPAKKFHADSGFLNNGKNSMNNFNKNKGHNSYGNKKNLNNKNGGKSLHSSTGKFLHTSVGLNTNVLKNSNNNNNGKNMTNGVKLSSDNYNTSQTLLSRRQTLPIYKVRTDLMKRLKENDTNILVGETGSGKTTQVPQFLYEDFLLTQGGVVVTQPRRVAATTIATRVAKEVGTDLGEVVGYSVRFEDVTSEKTKIKFATDGMVLREAMLDPLLKRYSWVILDEAHERTVNTDILFGVVKKAQKTRKTEKGGKRPLRILVMSATMNAEKFSKYFDNCPMLNAEGREHKLDIYFTTEKHDDYVSTCMRMVMTIHETAPIDHGILVFLTGQEEIDTVCQAMTKLMQRVDKTLYPPMMVSPLYAALAQHLQMNVFNQAPEGKRHVIFATNIAETSVTIPGVRYVVDSGKAKVRTYNPGAGSDVLKVRQISQAQAWQRAGRAGREANGTCHHIYTKEQFEKMPSMPAPEIHRTRLASVVLQLLTVGVTDVFKFDFIDRPTEAYIRNAVTQLLDLGAVTSSSGSGDLALTELGKNMAAFPLVPEYSKIILMGSKYNCTQEVLTIIAILSGEQVLTLPTGNMRTVARKCHQRLASVEGDHLTYLNIYQKFNAAKKNKQWCIDNFLNHRNLMYAASIRKQLSELCLKKGIKINSCGDNRENIKKCLLSGLFSQVAELQPGNKYLTLHSRGEAKIHPSSFLFETRSSYLLYTELLNTGSSFMHCVSWVHPEWLYEIAPDYFRKHHTKGQGAML